MSYVKKLDPRSKKVVFVGYCNTGYRLWDPIEKQIMISREFIFNEECFNGFKYKCDDEAYFDLLDEKSEKKTESNLLEGAITEENVDGSESENEKRGESENGSVNVDVHSPSSSENADDTLILEASDSEWIPSSDDDSYLNSTVIQDENGERRYPDRERHNVKRYPDQEASLAEIDHCPSTFSEALQSDLKSEWLKAMDDEMKSFEENQTWVLVERLQNKQIVKTKWGFKVKKRSNGETERYKARLVARGYTQVEGIDYFETFSPVVRQSTIRFLIALAVEFDLEISHLDVKTAFHYGKLHDLMHVEQPEGYVKKDQKDKVYLLKKAIYGLKQASRAWTENINDYLLSLGFTRSQLDPCVYLTL